MTIVKSYKSKATLLAGTSYDEVIEVARREHRKIEKLTKRRAYVRSMYFNKDKVFVSIFWGHLMQKTPIERTKRLKFYNAAIDLLRKSRCTPETLLSKDDLSNVTHRFYGITRDGAEYCVQVKQNKRTGRKDFISVFGRKNS